MEKKVAEAGYFPKGGFYDKNSDGKEDTATTSRPKSGTNIPYVDQKNIRLPKSEKTISGHEGEIPNSDPLPAGTQRA